MLKIIKLLFISLFLIYTNFVFAVDACVPNDTVAVVLNSTPTGFYSISSPKWTTSTGFRGTSACLSGDHGMKCYWCGGINNFIYHGKLMENDAIVVGGEKNGVYCWCKITYPVETYWWLLGTSYSDASNCWKNCPSNCGWDIVNVENYRAAIFNSIQN